MHKNSSVSFYFIFNLLFVVRLLFCFLTVALHANRFSYYYYYTHTHTPTQSNMWVNVNTYRMSNWKNIHKTVHIEWWIENSRTIEKERQRPREREGTEDWLSESMRKYIRWRRTHLEWRNNTKRYYYCYYWRRYRLYYYYMVYTPYGLIVDVGRGNTHHRRFICWLC